MREFHYGCFELRFACADDLMRGENFSIVAINGIEEIGIGVTIKTVDSAQYERLTQTFDFDIVVGSGGPHAVCKNITVNGDAMCLAPR